MYARTTRTACMHARTNAHAGSHLAVVLVMPRDLGGVHPRMREEKQAVVPACVRAGMFVRACVRGVRAWHGRMYATMPKASSATSRPNDGASMGVGGGGEYNLKIPRKRF